MANPSPEEGVRAASVADLNAIPAMTDPLGAYWRQPVDIRQAPMDEKTVLLTPGQFKALHEYSTSMPSGVYEGKCWRRQISRSTWMLGWYGPDSEPGYCSNNWRAIEVVS